MALSKEQKEWLKKISDDSINMKKVPKELFTDEFCLATVQQNGEALEYVPDALITEALCLSAIQQAVGALKFVPDTLKTEALCLAAVQENGYALQYVPDALKTEAVCFAAVQQDGDALRYIPDALKTEALCIEAMRHSSVHVTLLYRGGMGMQKPPPPTHPLQLVPDELKTEAVCLAAMLSDQRAYIPSNLSALDFMPEALRPQVGYLAEVFRSAISSGSGGSGYGIELI